MFHVGTNMHPVHSYGNMIGNWQARTYIPIHTLRTSTIDTLLDANTFYYIIHIARCKVSLYAHLKHADCRMWKTSLAVYVDYINKRELYVVQSKQTKKTNNCRWRSAPIQSTSQPVSQPTSQPTSQPGSQPFSHSASQPSIQSASQPADQIEDSIE